MTDSQLVALVAAVPFVLAVLIGWCCRWWFRIRQLRGRHRGPRRAPQRPGDVL